jgi:hypothetical protein
MQYEEFLENMRVFSCLPSPPRPGTRSAEDGRRFIMLPSDLDCIYGIWYFPIQNEIAFGRAVLTEILPPNGETIRVRKHEWLAVGQDVLTELPKHGYPLTMLQEAFARASSKRITKSI